MKLRLIYQKSIISHLNLMYYFILVRAQRNYGDVPLMKNFLFYQWHFFCRNVIQII